MDTPDPGVVKDSQNPRPSVTPKSAGFGSPVATQDSWTAPRRRRQVQQKPKASFLADDDDDDDDEQDEQNGRHAITNPPNKFDGDPNLDFVSYDFDSRLNEETGEDQDVFDQSPTPRASQAARLPPQSAQPILISRMTESPDEFEVFEDLKKQTAGTKNSNDPFKIPNQHEPPGQKQQQASATRDRPVSEGKKGPPSKDTRKPRAAARKALANSKVKLAALEVEGGNETRALEIQEQSEHDYSLPASNSSSPAAAPNKKRASAKKQAAKKPPTKAKGTAQKANVSAGDPVEDTKSAPDSPAYRSPEQDQDMLLADDPPKVIQAPRKADPPSQMKKQRLNPGQSPNESQKQDADTKSSDSTSSFPESENTDDEDFECSHHMTPNNARRRTRAAAAQSQAAKEAKKKAESKPAVLTSAQLQDVEDEGDHIESAKVPKTQPKQPAKKTAVEKTPAVTGRSEEEIKSSIAKPKEKGSVNERKAAENRTSKDNSDAKQKIVVSLDNDRLERSEVKKLCQKSEPVKQTKGAGRKPNIVAFGPGGPKNNGKSQKTTATDPQPRGQHSSPRKAERPAATKSQLSKGFHKPTKLQPDTVVQDKDSPMRDFAGHAEGRLGRAARANRSSVAGAISDISSTSKDDEEEIMPNLDAELERPNYKTDHDEASDQFIAPDAEAGSEDHQDHQDHDMGNAFNKGDGMASSPLAQADITTLHKREHRTVLGKVDANRRSSPRDGPAVKSRLMKRKLPDTLIVEERSPMQEGPPSKTGSQSRSFPRQRMNSTALNLLSEGIERPMKKPRHNPAHTGRVNEDEDYDSNLVGGLGIVSRGIDDTGDDVFGPGKSGKSDETSAFVQRLVSNESVDRGTGQPEWLAPTSSDTIAAPRKHAVSVSDAATVRNAAPGVMLRPQGHQQLDDVGKRMLAALEPEKEQVPEAWPRRDEPSKSFPMGDPTKTWLGDVFDQRRALDMDERTRAWKKATEPYDASLGETMHRIVNTILRGLKANEAAVADVVKDYREDGKQVVQRIARKHSKERLLVTRQQEQNRLGYVQSYREARHNTGTVLGKLKSVDVEQMVTHVEEATANRLGQLLQTITDA